MTMLSSYVCIILQTYIGVHTYIYVKLLLRKFCFFIFFFFFFFSYSCNSTRYTAQRFFDKTASSGNLHAGPFTSAHVKRSPFLIQLSRFRYNCVCEICRLEETGFISPAHPNYRLFSYSTQDDCSLVDEIVLINFSRLVLQPIHWKSPTAMLRSPRVNMYGVFWETISPMNHVKCFDVLTWPFAVHKLMIQPEAFTWTICNTHSRTSLLCCLLNVCTDSLIYDLATLSAMLPTA